MSTKKRGALSSTKAEETRARILDAALTLFSELGFAATSTKKIAERAQVSEGLIFHYFATKTELLAAIAETGPVVAAQLVGLLEQASADEVRVFLPRFARIVLGTVRQRANFFNMIIGESRSHAELYTLFGAIHERSARLIGDYLARRQRDGDVRADLPLETASRAVMAPLFLFFMTHRHLDDRAWEEAVVRFSDEMGDVWTRGLSSRP